MSFAINYQLSLFGKYSISPTPNTISTLMNSINAVTGKTFLPSIVNSQQIEIPSNKISTISNLGFFTQDQQYSIALLNERLDVNYNKINDSNEDMSLFFDLAIKVLSVVLDYSKDYSNRLAMNIQQVCDVKDSSYVYALGKNLLKAAAFYEDKELIEWSTRVNALQEIIINNATEGLNVITDISSGRNAENGMPVVLFHFDINTLPQNQNLRFDKSALHPFVHEASNIATKLIADVEGLICE